MTTTMTAGAKSIPLTRDVVEAFYRAYASRDPVRLDAVLDDDIDWLIVGPADQFDYYGSRRGKTDTIEVITRIMPCYFQIADFEIAHLLVHDGRAAVAGHVCARQRDNGRVIRFRFAHFLRFRDGRLTRMRSVADTFDVAEQVVGHTIALTGETAGASIVPDDVVTE